ncbi:MAG: DUF4373 domain-containing protein [Bacteroidaceae bacterium]|nr:DUF4373 domain-containing protein [Bacteroidaceae bacterium]
MASSYFSHDSNARNSKKLLRLRQAHGAAGYGVYFMLLERLREEGGYTSDRDYDMIAYDLREDKALIKSVVEDFGLFEISGDGKQFSSKGFIERMELREIRSQAGRKGASGRWGSFFSDDGKKEKKSKRESKNNTTKNEENMKNGDDKNPAQNGKEWQNDSKSDNLPMALNKIKVKRKEIKNKEKKSCVVFTLHDTDLEIPFKRQPDGKPEWTLEVATYMAFQLHMQHAVAETDRLIAYNLMHHKEAASWSAEQWFAAARMWQSKCKDQQTDARWNDTAWVAFIEALYVKMAERQEYNLMYELLDDYCKPGKAVNEQYELPTTNNLYEWIERNLDIIMADIKELQKATSTRFLFYRIKDK